MTNEEALGLVDECIVRGQITPQAHNFAMWETIRNALDKQIAKTPYNIDDHNECPVCGCLDIEQIDVSGMCEMPYCPHCGQAIDWSEDD